MGPETTRREMAPHTILFVAANLGGTDRCAFDTEARAIRTELESSGYRHCFRFETRWAMQALDLLRELRRLKPTVVHFSSNAHTHIERQHGVFFQGADNTPQWVPTHVLEDVFDAAGASVKVVVLNACYSEIHADALVMRIDCVVGMSGLIRDEAAKNFAIGFYGALAECESVATAYKQGRVAISLEGLRGADVPRLKTREGVDATQLILAMLPDRSAAT